MLKNQKNNKWCGNCSNCSKIECCNCESTKLVTIFCEDAQSEIFAMERFIGTLVCENHKIGGLNYVNAE
jgi:hypothetical protein